MSSGALYREHASEQQWTISVGRWISFTTSQRRRWGGGGGSHERAQVQYRILPVRRLEMGAEEERLAPRDARGMLTTGSTIQRASSTCPIESARHRPSRNRCQRFVRCLEYRQGIWSLEDESWPWSRRLRLHASQEKDLPQFYFSTWSHEICNGHYEWAFQNKNNQINQYDLLKSSFFRTDLSAMFVSNPLALFPLHFM